MARAVREANLASRDARRKLTDRAKPYWRLVEPGRHVGYYKGSRGGSWIARAFQGAGKYVECTLGLADDTSPADGIAILDFKQALDAARVWFHENHPETRGTHAGPYTIDRAAADYMKWFRDNRKSAYGTQRTIDAFVVPTLGSVEARALTTAQIRGWLSGLANSAPRLRSLKGAELKFRDFDAKDEEARRKRQSTANRILTVLKAVLNHAWREGKITNDAAWRRVAPFKGVEEARLRYLSQEECIRLVNACDPDFRPLVQAALFTGCRYGELIALQVADFNPDAGTLLIRQSKSGKARHVVLTEKGQAFFAILASKGKANDFLLPKSEGVAWGKSHQTRPLADACENGTIKPPASFHALRHTYASHMVMAGIPLIVVAQNLGHADTRMVEKHYAHLTPSFSASAIRNAAPELGYSDPGTVTKLCH